MVLARRHSKQGSVVPFTIIDSPADWTSAALKGKEDEFTYKFTQQDVDELVAAVEKIKERGVKTEEDVIKVLYTRYCYVTCAWIDYVMSLLCYPQYDQPRDMCTSKLDLHLQ